MFELTKRILHYLDLERKGLSLNGLYITLTFCFILQEEEERLEQERLEQERLEEVSF